MLRLAFVTGTEPGKWFSRYRDTTGHGLEDFPSDDPFALLIDGRADLALLRLPDPRVGVPGEKFHQVVLYSEKPGVAVPKDSVYAEVGEAVRLSDLADEHVNYRFDQSRARADEPGVEAAGEVSPSSACAGVAGAEVTGAEVGGSVDELRSALQVVAANVGVAFAPAPLLKVLSKKRVAVLELIGEEGSAQHPETSVALVWEVEKDSDAIQDFVGVAKGRTRNSSRGREMPEKARRRAEVNRKFKSKNTAQRKRFRSNHPSKGVRGNQK